MVLIACKICGDPVLFRSIHGLCYDCNTDWFMDASYKSFESDKFINDKKIEIYQKRLNKIEEIKKKIEDWF